jgi:hypothetical protein
MRIITLAAFLFLSYAISALGQDRALPFTENGKKYSLTYALNPEETASAGLPRTVTFINHIGGSWYLVKLSNGSDTMLNMDNVVTCTEMWEEPAKSEAPVQDKSENAP